MSIVAPDVRCSSAVVHDESIIRQEGWNGPGQWIYDVGRDHDNEEESMSKRDKNEGSSRSILGSYRLPNPASVSSSAREKRIPKRCSHYNERPSIK